MENNKLDVIDWLNDIADGDDWPSYYSDSEIRLLAKDALELLKAQEPRVITLEEAIETVSKEGGFVWIEEKPHPCAASHLFPCNNIWDCSSRRFIDYGKEFTPERYSARFMWRCWSSWPTDAQMEAVKWE